MGNGEKAALMLDGHAINCECNLCIAANSAGASRRVDLAKVQTRNVVFTPEQEMLKRVVDTRLTQICPNAETAVALVTHILSELLLRTAQPGLIGVAVATAERCLKLNCGLCVCSLADIDTGYINPQCAVHGKPADTQVSAKQR